MPHVTLYYGPYKTNGIIRHKTQRLYGILTCLTNLGYEIDIVPSPYLEKARVEMKGRTIFHFNVTSLLFNGEYDDDPVCQSIVKAVEEAKPRFYSEHNVPKYTSDIKHERLIRQLKYLKRDSLLSLLLNNMVKNNKIVVNGSNS